MQFYHWVHQQCADLPRGRTGDTFKCWKCFGSGEQPAEFRVKFTSNRVVLQEVGCFCNFVHGDMLQFYGGVSNPVLYGN